MAEGYRFKEVRKGEREAVIAFASGQGCAIAPEDLRHHLSLAVEAGGQLVAAALSTETQPSQIVIEIVVGDPSVEPALLTELADRCLRKVQASSIASVRLHSPAEAPTDTIWTQTNWLDRIEEATPPQAEPDDQAPAEAA